MSQPKSDSEYINLSVSEDAYNSGKVVLCLDKESINIKYNL